MSMADSVPGDYAVGYGLGTVPVGAIASATGAAAQIGSQSFAASQKKGKPTRAEAGTQMGIGAALGAATGASVGTAIFPVIGTAVGAVVGAIAGAVPGIISMVKAAEGGSSREKRMSMFGGALNLVNTKDVPEAVSVVRAAEAEILRFRDLAERAQTTIHPGVLVALGQAVTPNQQLSAAGNALVADVNAYVEGRDRIDPWDLKEPALLAAQRIDDGTKAVAAALGPAREANLGLEAALAAGGA